VSELRNLWLIVAEVLVVEEREGDSLGFWPVWVDGWQKVFEIRGPSRSAFTGRAV